MPARKRRGDGDIQEPSPKRGDGDDKAEEVPEDKKRKRKDEGDGNNVVPKYRTEKVRLERMDPETVAGMSIETKHVRGRDVHVLVIGDTHFEPQRNEDTQVMAENVLTVVKRLVDYLDAVILLGDIIDRFNMRALADAEKWVYSLSKLIPVFVLVGNHDLASHADFLQQRHPFAMLNMLDNVTVVDHPLKVIIKGINVLMVPYVPDGRFDEAIRMVDPDLEYLETCHATFSHQTIYMSLYNGIRNTNGDKWALSRPYLVNGHIHEQSDVQDNVKNLGSPYQISHGEPENNSIMILRLKPGPEEGDDSMEEISALQGLLKLPIATPGEKATHKFARLCEHQLLSLKVPVKRTTRLTYQEFCDYTYEEDPRVFQLRIVIKGSKSEIQSLYSDKKIRALKRLSPRVVIKYEKLSVGQGEVSEAHKGTFLEMLKDGADADVAELINRIFGMT